MAASDAQKRAIERYTKREGRAFSMRFYPPDHDLYDWLQEQPNKAGYVKALIRADMERRKSG